MKQFYFILALAVSSIANAVIMPISAVRQAAIGSTVTFRGLVTNGAELGNNIRYLQDATGGIAAYSSSVSSYGPGDSLEITGTTVDYQTLLEINPIISVTLLNSGNALPAPQIITPIQMDEPLEGQLVQLNNVIFSDGGTSIGGGTTYPFSINGESSIIYVRAASPLIGEILPTGPCNITGIVSEYGGTYQLLIRYATDIVSFGSIHITSTLQTSNITTTGFSLNWKTDAPGNTFVKYGTTNALSNTSNFINVLDTNHTITLNNLTPGTIYYCQAFSMAANGDTAYSAIRPFATKSLSSGNIKVYFNSTVNNSVATTQQAQQLYYAIDDTLIAYINRANHTLDMTIYDFNNTNISNISTAINAAKTRGVKVRFISDGSLAPTNSGVTQLSSNIPKIQSPTTSQYNIMHNKFVIIDAFDSNPNKPIVWTGSTNWTDRQINRDNNNVIIIQDQSLAKAYTLEFEEMWGDTSATPNLVNSKFGQFKTDNTPHEFRIGPNNTRIESYFSPSDETNAQLLKTINTANKEMYFATMLNTRIDLATAMVNKINTIPNFIMKGLVDNSASSTQWNTMLAAMTSTNLLQKQDTSIIMHHKYCIIDNTLLNSDPILWTGSHNWSTNANTLNDENSLAVHDATVANVYYQEFVSRFQENGGLVLNVKSTSESKDINLFPTVVQHISDLKYYLSENAQSMQMQIIGLDGKVIFDKTSYSHASGFYTIDENLDITPTIYLVKFMVDGNLTTKKIVVE